MPLSDTPHYRPTLIHTQKMSLEQAQTRHHKAQDMLTPLHYKYALIGLM